jgi:hypothetical protein
VLAVFRDFRGTARPRKKLAYIYARQKVVSMGHSLAVDGNIQNVRLPLSSIVVSV